MILDSSALVAILLHQADSEWLLDTLSGADLVAIGAPTLLESSIVVSARLGGAEHALARDFVREAGIEVLPFGEHHLEVAVDAFVRYGKGQHPAALNFGDCMAYATAVLAGQPLLYVGDDFARTDIESAAE